MSRIWRTASMARSERRSSDGSASLADHKSVVTGFPGDGTVMRVPSSRLHDNAAMHLRLEYRNGLRVVHDRWATMNAGVVRKEASMISLLWLLFLVLLILWIVGFAVNWGAFIWVLLIAAVAVLVLNLISASRSGRWY